MPRCFWQLFRFFFFGCAAFLFWCFTHFRLCSFSSPAFHTFQAVQRLFSGVSHVSGCAVSPCGRPAWTASPAAAGSTAPPLLPQHRSLQPPEALCSFPLLRFPIKFRILLKIPSPCDLHRIQPEASRSGTAPLPKRPRYQSASTARWSLRTAPERKSANRISSRNLQPERWPERNFNGA